MLAPMLLTSTGVAKLGNTFPYVFGLHLSSWSVTRFALPLGAAPPLTLVRVYGYRVAQFASHFLAEGRAPALLDNLLGGECCVFTLLPLALSPWSLALLSQRLT